MGSVIVASIIPLLVLGLFWPRKQQDTEEAQGQDL